MKKGFVFLSFLCAFSLLHAKDSVRSTNPLLGTIAIDEVVAFPGGTSSVTTIDENTYLTYGLLFHDFNNDDSPDDPYKVFELTAPTNAIAAELSYQKTPDRFEVMDILRARNNYQYVYASDAVKRTLYYNGGASKATTALQPCYIEEFRPEDGKIFLACIKTIDKWNGYTLTAFTETSIKFYAP